MRPFDSEALSIATGSPFPLQSLPLGIGRRRGGMWRAWVAIGEHAVDLAVLDTAGWLADVAPGGNGSLFLHPSLNDLLACGPEVTRAVRARVRELLLGEVGRLPSEAFARQDELQMTLPVVIGDYADFYSSIHHATNLGRLFRPDSEPLLPNWRHLPIGYSGRAATVVPDGTEVVRPSGIRLIDGTPTYGPSRALDIELEVGAVVGLNSALGEPLPAAMAEGHLAGLCLVNDWSARDIQAFEYQPLGPFCAKSFATSMSPWLVPLDALEPFRVNQPEQQPPVAEHLRTTAPSGFDLYLEVLLDSAKMRQTGLPPMVVARTTFAEMYWTPAQQLAHLTSGGARVRTGDLIASGTVSGPSPGTEGSLIELTWRGERPLDLPDGSTRSYLADGDRVVLRGWAGADPGTRIGLGAVAGTIVPSTKG